MRLGIAMVPRPGVGAAPPPVLDAIVAFARAVERLEFSGLWVLDSIGRGRATLDPLMVLSALCPATSRIELGTAILQLPLRNPRELAHRVQSLNLFANGRLRLGIGAGSTETDFAFVGAEYRPRFRTLVESLGTMRALWRGEAAGAGTLASWPGTEQGPPVLLGAWHSPRAIRLAAESCQGWIASGLHSSWDDIENGVRMYRAAGGTRVVVANIPADLRPEPERTAMAEHARLSLVCAPALARDRLRRLEQLGVDDALLLAPFAAPGHLHALRALL